ncbi:phage portal protein [Microbispora sp. NPDC088329]|uniref:phage portal protein n=1 Tax=Microbispora sp. NPDC088329 TaxID=3154869 RepID=UPI00342BC022
MGVLERIAAAYVERAERPSADARFGWDDYLSLFTGGDPFVTGFRQTLTGSQERIEGNFEGIVNGAYKRSGVVFACILARLLVFSEARFQWQRMQEGRPGILFGTPELALLETPWPNGTTGDLLARMEQDASMAGNFYATIRRGRQGRRVVRMRPDWVTIVLGSDDDPQIEPWDLDAELVGYYYQPGGPGSDREPTFLLPEEVAHYAPIPDPLATYRGMSWLTGVMREIEADQAATTHKLKFFTNGATPNMVVSLDAAVTPDMFERFKAKMDASHKGVRNAYKTLYLGGGADVKVVGSDFQQMSFKTVQGAGETRIAAAAGVPPVIVGLSEGLQSATYSNYAQARRRFADGTLRPLWRSAAGALATLLTGPSGGNARLWYDDRDISFLREDAKEAAEILRQQASTINQLIMAGYEADSVIAAVTSGDFTVLKHTGLFSVQLQPPGTVSPSSDPGQKGQ